MNATDIVGYTYRAEQLHPECLIEELCGNNVLHEFWLKAGAEAMLTAEARTAGIDRMDEHSFDSDEFPKVIFCSQVIEGECCDRCGADLLDDPASNP